MVFQPKFLSTILSTLKHFFIDLIIFNHLRKIVLSFSMSFDSSQLQVFYKIIYFWPKYVTLTKKCYFELTLFVYYSLLQINVKMDAVPRCSLLNKKRLFSYHFRLKEDWNGKSWGACQKNGEFDFCIIKKTNKSFFSLSSNQICEAAMYRLV